MQSKNNIVKLNIGGKRFETLRSTLLSIEGTYFTGLLDCENPLEEEYFIDRDGEKFSAILSYFRGNTSVYIDPTEAAFYALPLPSLSFHELVEKDTLLVHRLFSKHQTEILGRLKGYFQDNSPVLPAGLIIGERLIGWTLFGGKLWESKSLSYVKSPFEIELIETFSGPVRIQAVIDGAKSFWKTQGLLCSIEKKYNYNGGYYYPINFSWNNDTGSLDYVTDILSETIRGAKSLSVQKI